ncbi:MAG: MATE family efflux transporter [Oscillospiraceae bacterium]|nr:MATE family efflux transporter [Oscillospiraceae bacterium]
MLGSKTRNAEKGNFAVGSIPSNILRMAGPMILAQLINVLYNMVDRMYIGRLAETGRLALTGIGICTPAISIIIAFANLCGMGGAPLFAQARGRGDDEEAGRIMGNAFVMLLFWGLVLIAVGYTICSPLLYWLGADEQTHFYAGQYFTVYLAGTLSVMISLGMNPFVNAQGSSGFGMLTVAIGAVINILLDPVFIFILNMGVQGAALATVLSQTVSAIWVLRFLTRPGTRVPLRRQNLKPQKRLVARITALGASGFMLSFTNSIVQMLYNTQLRDLGGTMYVSIMTIINSVREIVFSFVNGLTNGATPVIGYNYGAGKRERVRTSIRFVTLVSLSYCLLAWAMVQLFPQAFIRIFNNDPDLLALGTHCFRLYFAAIFAMSFQLTGQIVSHALGKAKTAMFFSLLRKVILVTPLIFILPHVGNLGADGILLSEPISNVIGGTACWLTMYFTVYRPLGKEAPAQKLSS